MKLELLFLDFPPLFFPPFQNELVALLCKKKTNEEENIGWLWGLSCLLVAWLERPEERPSSQTRRLVRARHSCKPPPHPGGTSASSHPSCRDCCSARPFCLTGTELIVCSGDTPGPLLGGQHPVHTSPCELPLNSAPVRLEVGHESAPRIAPNFLGQRLRFQEGLRKVISIKVL